MSDYKYFKVEDFNCQETGENEMHPEFIKKLDHLREICGFPFIITSGYRSPNHSLERSKPNGGGSHTKGIAADIRASGGSERYQIQKHAYAFVFDTFQSHQKLVCIRFRFYWYWSA